MQFNEVEALRIFRLLTLEHQADLLTWVHIAYVAENSARKSFEIGGVLKPRGSPNGNLLQRSKK